VLASFETLRVVHLRFDPLVLMAERRLEANAFVVQAAPNRRFRGPRGVIAGGLDGATAADRILDHPAPPTPAAVTVAVLGNGVHLAHPGLAGAIRETPAEVPDNGRDDDGNGFVDDRHGYDFADRDPDPSPESAAACGDRPARIEAEGTHAAGTVVSVFRALAGVGGPRIAVLPVRVLSGACAEGDGAAILAGLDYAIAAGARIVLLDVAGIGGSGLVRRMLEGAAERGILVLVPGAGPADAASAFLTVAGIGGEAPPRPPQGTDTAQLAAPGDAVIGPVPPAGYGRRDGDGAAAAIVAGVAAALAARWPELPMHRIAAALLDTATRVPALQPWAIGGRRLDAVRALRQGVPPARFLVMAEDHLSAAHLAAHLSAYAPTVTVERTLIGRLFKVSLGSSRPESELLRAIAAIPGVTLAEPDSIMTAQ
jgi:hypothetical protein